MQSGAIWIIDDDQDDLLMIRQIWEDLNVSNKLVWLTSAEKAISHLREVPDAPYIIICEVNLPKIDGFQCREMMLAEPDKNFHTVPFIFLSSYATEQQIRKAYDLSVHGFFIKESAYDDIKDSFAGILHYWQKSRMPAKREPANKKAG